MLISKLRMLSENTQAFEFVQLLNEGLEECNPNFKNLTLNLLNIIGRRRMMMAVMSAISWKSSGAPNTIGSFHHVPKSVSNPSNFRWTFYPRLQDRHECWWKATRIQAETLQGEIPNEPTQFDRRPVRIAVSDGDRTRWRDSLAIRKRCLNCTFETYNCRVRFHCNSTNVTLPRITFTSCHIQLSTRCNVTYIVVYILYCIHVQKSILIDAYIYFVANVLIINIFNEHISLVH